jgi:dTDP-4-amino-4,6-dideoxygalactose transaminase
MKIFKKPIFVSISPNAQADDVWLAFKLMFCPWKWKEGKSIAEFERMLGEYLSSNSHPEFISGSQEMLKQVENKFSASKQYDGKFSVSIFESGRTALYAILLALGIGKGDEVLIQAFTCTAAVNPILWVGAKPIYVDVETGTYNMSPGDLEKKITPQCKALIIQNTFGYLGKIDDLLEIAKKNNLIVLEDCAHNLGAVYKDQKIGTIGEASFFSFGRSKIISAVFGGAAVSKNPALAKKIREIHDNWPYPPGRWIAQQLTHPWYMAFAKFFYDFFSLGKIMVVLAKKLRFISMMVYPVEKTGGKPFFSPSRMPNALAVLAINQMRKIEKFNKHRRELAGFYNRNLSSLRKQGSINWPSEYSGNVDSRFRGNDNDSSENENNMAKPVYLNFPIQVKDSITRRNCIKAARQQGIYLESWPSNSEKVIGPDSTNQEKLFYQKGLCPIAEKMAQVSIILPTGPNTNIRDAERVVKFLKNYFLNA